MDTPLQPSPGARLSGGTQRGAVPEARDNARQFSDYKIVRMSESGTTRVADKVSRVVRCRLTSLLVAAIHCSYLTLVRDR